jgi:hypothetical protein
MALQGRPTKNRALTCFFNPGNILFSSFIKNDLKRPPLPLWFRLGHARHPVGCNDISL